MAQMYTAIMWLSCHGPQLLKTGSGEVWIRFFTSSVIDSWRMVHVNHFGWTFRKTHAHGAWDHTKCLILVKSFVNTFFNKNKKKISIKNKLNWKFF